MIIRPARPEDVPDLVTLWREMWSVHEAADPRFASTPAADLVMSKWLEEHVASERSCVRVAEEEARRIGYALGVIYDNPPVTPWPLFGYISEVSVAPEARRRGVGTRLVEALQEWFHEKGCSYAEANVAAVNGASRRFWRRMGYSEYVERLRKELT